MTLTADEARAITDSRLAHTELDWIMAAEVYPLIHECAKGGDSMARLPLSMWVGDRWDLISEVVKRLERGGYTVEKRTFAEHPEVRISW